MSFSTLRVTVASFTVIYCCSLSLFESAVPLESNHIQCFMSSSIDRIIMIVGSATASISVFACRRGWKQFFIASKKGCFILLSLTNSGFIEDNGLRNLSATSPDFPSLTVNPGRWQIKFDCHYIGNMNTHMWVRLEKTLNSIKCSFKISAYFLNKFESVVEIIIQRLIFECSKNLTSDRSEDITNHLIFLVALLHSYNCLFYRIFSRTAVSCR